nr:MAG TPA: hypothetical protein [Caudoviricetes sp.]
MYYMSALLERQAEARLKHGKENFFLWIVR